MFGASKEIEEMRAALREVQDALRSLSEVLSGLLARVQDLELKRRPPSHFTK
jgi:hypothetical protein